MLGPRKKAGPSNAFAVTTAESFSPPPAAPSAPKRAAKRLACASRSRSASRERKSSGPAEEFKGPGQEGRVGKPVKPEGEEKKKREKEFAWMDSGDDGEESDKEKGAEGKAAQEKKDGGNGTAKESRGRDKDRRSPRRSRSRSRSRRRSRRRKSRTRSRSRKGRSRKKAEDEDAEDEPEVVDNRPLGVRLADVTAFADMIRLSSTLRKTAGRLPPKELSLAIVSAARVKFYDAEVFQNGILPAVRRQVQRGKGGGFTVSEAVDLLSGLAELNCYDETIFSKLVEFFADNKQELEDSTRRMRLLTSFRKAGHKEDKDFLDYLAQREKAERYEQRLKELQGNHSGGPQIYYGGLRK